MTDSAFPGLTQAEKIFKNLVWDPMIKAGEVWIEGQVPFLAFPVIKQVDEFVLEEITNAIFNNFVKLIDITAIQLVGAARNASFQKNFESLAILADEKGADSDEFKKAQDAAILELRSFGRMGA